MKMKCWLPYRLEEQENGKIKKPPYNPRNGLKFANWNQEGAQVSFEQAEASMDKYGLSGVGFVVPMGYVVIDIDETPDEHVEAIIKMLDSYTEFSPGGRVHIICRADPTRVPDKKNKWVSPDGLNLEYFPGREIGGYFVTYTGKAFEIGLEAEERTKEILEFLDKYQKLPEENKKPLGVSSTETAEGHRPKNQKPHKDIISLARKAKNSKRFLKLFDEGDISDYGGDASRADLALCRSLAWWSGGDFDEIDRLFRQSALYREKWERDDYRLTTINKGIEACHGEFYRPPGRPQDPNKIKNTKNTGGSVQQRLPTLSIEAVQRHLDATSMSARYNLITNSIDVAGLEEAITSEHTQNSLPIMIYDQLRDDYRKVNKGDIRDYLGIIALRHKYNPVLDLIGNVIWDGVDRIPELFKVMRIAENDRLSKTLVYKWLWQCLSLARNTSTKTQEPYGADGVLVLVGKQGIGKTSLLRSLAMKNEFFLEGAKVNPDNKDSVITATSKWIVELGEIGSTFRSDLDHLKSFITRQEDVYRKPYGHSDLKLARKTSFCGTCNDIKYLIDPTGNRRFWTVLTNGIDLDALSELNILQLWTQIDGATRRNRQGFRLNRDEQIKLEKRNAGHEKPVKALEEILDLIARADEGDLEYKEVTVSQFKAEHDILRPYTVKQIGEALEKSGIQSPQKQHRIDGRIGRYRKLPMYR